MTKPIVLISSPLEDEHVARIRREGGARIQVVHEPGLLPVPRYVADHKGAPRAVTPEMQTRWSALLADADISFDFDLLDPANMPRNAPKLRWVQATSSGIGEFLKKTGLDKSNIVFTTAAGVHARPLAEFSMLGLLHFFRDVPFLNQRKQAKHWERYTVRGLAGARALVIGLGEVGRAIARDAALFGMDVWGLRRLGRSRARRRQPHDRQGRPARCSSRHRRPDPRLPAHRRNPASDRYARDRGIEARRGRGQCCARSGYQRGCLGRCFILRPSPRGGPRCVHGRASAEGKPALGPAQRDRLTPLRQYRRRRERAYRGYLPRQPRPLSRRPAAAQ